MTNSLVSLVNIAHSEVAEWLTEIQGLNWTGRLPSYIPQLAQVNPHQIALHIQPLHQPGYSWNSSVDSTLSVPLMSVIKPFVLLYLLEEVGVENTEQMVGCLPSNLPYNSLEQLEIDRGFPRNPMINSGAIALCSHLPGNTATQKVQRFSQWLNNYGQTQLRADRHLLLSVESLPNIRNQELTQRLANSGYLGSSEWVALDTYQQVCCLAGTIADLVKLGLGLVDGKGQVNAAHQARVLQLILSCGLYEYSAEFAVEVGLPTKSGVSGILLSVVPEQGAIAIYSPLLDPVGNSAIGMVLLQRIARYLREKDESLKATSF